jgi:hypothetical protein
VTVAAPNTVNSPPVNPVTVTPPTATQPVASGNSSPTSAPQATPQVASTPAPQATPQAASTPVSSNPVSSPTVTTPSIGTTTPTPSTPVSSNPTPTSSQPIALPAPVNTLPSAVSSAVNPTSTQSPASSSIPLVNPITITAPNQVAPPPTGTSSASSVTAPVGSVPVGNPVAVKPPASAVKPVSSAAPPIQIKVQDDEFDAFLAILYAAGIAGIDSLSEYDKRRYREIFYAIDPNCRVNYAVCTDTTIGTSILLLGLEVFTNQVAGSEAALDIAQINEMTRGMDPQQRLDFVLDMAFTIMNIKDDPGRLRAYLDQQRQLVFNKRNQVGDRFTASSVRLGGFKLGAEDRKSAQKIVQSVGNRQQMKNDGVYFDMFDFLLSILPWGAVAKLLKGPFKWMLRYFPGLKNGLDDFARGAVGAWNKSKIGQTFARRGFDCNSFTADTKVWVTRAANDLTSKTKSTLEKTKAIAKTALTAVAISSITVGTQVLAHNEQTKLESPQIVTATHKHIDPIIVTLKLETSDKKLETVTTTPEHPFFALLEPNKNANGVWVNAGELQPNNWLKRANGETGIVKSVSIDAKAQKMYNLTVEKDHTFFAGDGQWLVHNCPDLGPTFQGKGGISATDIPGKGWHFNISGGREIGTRIREDGTLEFFYIFGQGGKAVEAEFVPELNQWVCDNAAKVLGQISGGMSNLAGSDPMSLQGRALTRLQQTYTAVENMCGLIKTFGR